MSGPFLIELSGDIFGGPEVDGILLNGTIGSMALYVQPPADMVVFDLYIGGRLNVKEKNCAERRTPYLKAARRSIPAAVSDRVKP